MNFNRIAARIAQVDPLELEIWNISDEYGASSDEDWVEYVAEFFRSTPRPEWSEEGFREYCDIYAESF